MDEKTGKILRRYQAEMPGLPNEPAKRVKEGEVALVKIGGETTVKRVFGPKKGMVYLRGDNPGPKFAPIVVDANEDFQIIGRVIRIVEGVRT